MHQLAGLCARRFELPTGSLVVELGSNIGTQLEVFRDAGMRVLGVDPARNLAEIAHRKGIATLPEFFSVDLAGRIERDYGRPRLILGRHVFAHIDDLREVIEGVQALLDRTAVFAIEVPYLLDLLDANQFDTIYHEHLSYFSVGTLVRLFERHGLRVVDVERFAVHGGSILVFAGLPDGQWAVRPIVSQLVELEERSGLTGERRYRRFAERVEQTRKALGELVRRLAGEGKHVAGYGAPAKGNTLLNACGLGPRDLVFVSDTTEFKQGKVLPGTHIPVCTPTFAKQHPPDYYLLLAWNYAREVIQKESRYLREGGRFIVPIPEPLVVSATSVVGGEFIVQSREGGVGQLWALDSKGMVEFTEGEIQGVVFKPLTIHRDARGGLAELFRCDELPAGLHPKMATLSWTEPGASRGPHEHGDQSNFLVFPGPQHFMLALWDNRPDSPTYRHTLKRMVGGEQPVAVLVPAGVVHAYRNHGPGQALSLNFPNRLFRGERRQRADEAIRHEEDRASPFRM
ncbi:methyltransferase domain-containing protein [Nitrospira sp. Kam-Ns4a]